ncbi:hypothetical protein D3C75_1390170 [compost metagenome]
MRQAVHQYHFRIALNQHLQGKILLFLAVQHPVNAGHTLQIGQLLGGLAPPHG